MEMGTRTLAGKYMPEILAHYVEASGSGIELDDPDFGIPSAISDLVTDLMHVADLFGIDFDDRLAIAEHHYGEEVAPVD